MKWRWMLLGLWAVAASTSAAWADRVILQSGSEVSGTILKSDEQAVVVDLGCAVLRLARGDVARIVKAGPASTQATQAGTQPAGATATAEAAEKTSPQGQLYHTAGLTPGTIEDKSEQFGQAVVMVNSPGGQGSGFLISPDGYLITNYHVIAGETRIKVTVFERTDKGFRPRNYKKVRIVAMNPFVDLALLKIEEGGSSFRYTYLGDLADVQVGNPVFAIGNPLGLTRTVSQGIVSSNNRNFGGQLYIQTTTDINPGNSGGPLFNLKGEVVGVTSMGYLFLGGLNFAIPVDTVKRFIENRDAFAYDEDNPNAGFRYLQPAGRQNKVAPPPGLLPAEIASQADSVTPPPAK